MVGGGHQVRYRHAKKRNGFIIQERYLLGAKDKLRVEKL